MAFNKTYLSSLPQVYQDLYALIKKYDGNVAMVFPGVPPTQTASREKTIYEQALSASLQLKRFLFNRAVVKYIFVCSKACSKMKIKLAEPLISDFVLGLLRRCQHE